LFAQLGKVGKDRERGEPFLALSLKSGEAVQKKKKKESKLEEGWCSRHPNQNPGAAVRGKGVYKNRRDYPLELLVEKGRRVTIYKRVSARGQGSRELHTCQEKKEHGLISKA